MKVFQMSKMAMIIVVAVGLSTPIVAQTNEAPYGAATFSSYADIDKVKELKVVWDFNFSDPKAIGVVLNNLNALLRATAEFGPHVRFCPLADVPWLNNLSMVAFCR